MDTTKEDNAEKTSTPMNENDMKLMGEMTQKIINFIHENPQNSQGYQ